ncbi:unnamed protein product, partial [marine sediment metagenome]
IEKNNYIASHNSYPIFISEEYTLGKGKEKETGTDIDIEHLSYLVFKNYK